MTRHLVRSLLLWLGAMPLTLIGTMKPLVIGAWVFVTAYIFVGIEDVGSQVNGGTHSLRSIAGPSAGCQTDAACNAAPIIDTPAADVPLT